MIVEVYKNLTKSRQAKSTVYSIRDSKTKKVINWSNAFTLKNVTFHINEKARQRVIANKRKEVHAWVKGELLMYDILPSLRRKITYDPYKDMVFHFHSGKKIENASVCSFTPRGVYV